MLNVNVCITDFGYDISDYFSIQPEYGTMADFDELIAKAKELGKLCRRTKNYMFQSLHKRSFVVYL